ncbi:transglycosylase SLT domain-containing protein [Planosporangium thailandense]|uniref:Transglycosylase SLT domain-containing protein n=1 Tax=Planosporangium thailandense TaxID=765197 RepID=A0ABX0Y0C3_9ACTN|nr:transglycosylase SLT domain-containing protein [Planosporangium thailandense]NJC71791.1 transglycosylase SLT domain-containing protein [Planosporangium thailandense]
MSFVDVSDRIQQIRSQLGLDAPTTAATTSATTTAAGTTASGALFASALDSAQSGWLGGLSASGGMTGDAVVADARRYLGIPYVYGSNDPAKGLDCSGLVQKVYGDLGIKLPRVAADQAKVGQPVASLAQAQPGDLLAFGSPVHHIAIYIGGGKMIAAPQTGDVVKVQDVYETPTAIRRILPDSAPAILPALRPAALTAGMSLSAASLSAVSSSGAGALAGVPYADIFTTTANRYGLPPTLLAAVAKVESGYNPSAVSPAGAQGLMQLMPSTARGLGVDPLDPTQAVDGAARLLSNNLRQFGSVPLALAAYNAGGGAVRRYGGIPPFAETQAYVPKVQAAMAALQGMGSS